MNADDLKKVANSGGYGTGAKILDKLAAKRERRENIPERIDMNELAVANDLDTMVCSFGYDADDGKDYFINSDNYAAIRDDSTAGQDARAFAALWNAYREGDLVWRE